MSREKCDRCGAELHQHQTKCPRCGIPTPVAVEQKVRRFMLFFVVVSLFSVAMFFLLPR